VHADRGAVLISRSLAEYEGDSGGEPDADERVDAWLREAERLLTSSLAALRELLDDDWSMRIVRNLRVLFLVRGRPENGVEVLDAIADQSGMPLRAECLRLSALLCMSADNGDGRALLRFRTAASLRGGERASLLVEYASIAEHSYADFDTALALYDDALALLPRNTIYANALNDSALVAARLGDDQVAMQRLLTAAELASSREDRVLGSLVELNLGELLSRVERFAQARPHLQRAAELSEAIGDLERASTAFSSWAVTFPNDESTEDLSEAASLAAKALTLAKISQDDFAAARALSAQATIAFAEGEYEAARDVWTTARRMATPAKQAVYDGFLLQTLARLDDWPRFRAKMERSIAAAQRNRTQLVLAEALWPSANYWLRLGDVRRSAKVLACSILLAHEGYNEQTRLPLSESETATKREAILGAATAMAYVGQLLVLDVIPEHLRHALRPELEKALVGYGAASDLAAEIIDFVAKFVEEDDES
jgi:tetratricopeptide (TPR) repeat protein